MNAPIDPAAMSHFIAIRKLLQAGTDSLLMALPTTMLRLLIIDLSRCSIPTGVRNVNRMLGVRS